MLEVRGLRKSFGAIDVTRNVSFALAKGERRVILGPNGAGKTTLFNLIAGALKPSAGDILVDGSSIVQLSVDARARIGLARSFQKNNLFEELTVRDNLMLASAAAQRKAGWMMKDSFADRQVRAAAEAIAEQVWLSPALDQQVRHISYGLRRQLEVALALATGPRILLMDEPTSGVGPGMIEGFHRLMEALPKELTILVIEHDLDIAFSIADRITVLNYGEVVFEGTPAEARGNATVRAIYLADGHSHA